MDLAALRKWGCGVGLPNIYRALSQVGKYIHPEEPHTPLTSPTSSRKIWEFRHMTLKRMHERLSACSPGHRPVLFQLRDDGSSWKTADKAALGTGELPERPMTGPQGRWGWKPRATGLCKTTRHSTGRSSDELKAGGGG